MKVRVSRELHYRMKALAEACRIPVGEWGVRALRAFRRVLNDDVARVEALQSFDVATRTNSTVITLPVPPPGELAQGLTGRDVAAVLTWAANGAEERIKRSGWKPCRVPEGELRQLRPSCPSGVGRSVGRRLAKRS